MGSYFAFKIRNILFWCNDLLKGGSIFKNYREIKKVNELSSDEIRLFQEKKVSELLQHAQRTTAFYQGFTSNNLEDYPLVNKTIIKEQMDCFLSSQFLKEELITRSTSGSTGTPFVTYQNLNKLRRVNAETIYYSEKAGYKVGKKLIYMRAMTPNTRKSKWKLFMQNEVLIDCTKDDEETIENTLGKLADSSKKGAMLLGYGSTFTEFKEYFEKYGASIAKKAKLTGIVSGSNYLFEETRTSMADAFDCPVYSRYSTMEIGFVGQDDGNDTGFIINEASFKVQVYDLEKDVPVNDGEIGRIVVTDFYNYAMPLINYDTGDLGALSYIVSNGKCKRAITNFSGRKIDIIYDVNGKKITALSLAVKFRAFPEIKQFQFIQEDVAKYTILLNVDEDFNREIEVIQLMKSFVGETEDITVQRVQEIPLLSSGKRQFAINKMVAKNKIE